MKKWVIIIIISLSVILGMSNVKADSIIFDKSQWSQLNYYLGNSLKGAKEFSSSTSSLSVSSSNYDRFYMSVNLTDYVTGYYNQLATIIIPMSDDLARVLASSTNSYIDTYFANSTISGVHINTILTYIPNVSEDFSALGISFIIPTTKLRGFRVQLPIPDPVSLTNQKIDLVYSIYEGEYEYVSSPELYITDTHDSTNHDATITVDTSDFSDGNYKYKWGYDQMPMAMHEIVSGSNGFTITVPYNDTIYFAVLNQDDTLVYETTYTIDYDDMPNQYTLHFHSYTDWGVNDIVKFVNDNTDYTDLDNFWEAGERYIFFYGYQRRVALGFYTDSNLTNEITFGTFCVEHDMNIYVKWSKKLPTYQARVYADEDKIKLNIQITEWLEESDNYRIFISQDIAEKNWTMTRGNYTDSYINTTTVDYDENVTLKFGYIENGTPKIIFTEEIDISVWITLNATEEEQEAINLINEAYNITNHIDGMKLLKDFIEMLKVPISFITRLISYIFSKMNFHTRLFVIGMFVANILVAVAKLIFRR